MEYGNKKDYKKIDIFTKRKFTPKGMIAIWQYECSTTWSKTCKQAKEMFLKRHNYLDKTQIKALFSKN